jgi:hypothetical protein
MTDPEALERRSRRTVEALETAHGLDRAWYQRLPGMVCGC